MPDPYKGNDKAASFVQYYASQRMMKESVYRLHNKGIEEKRRAIKRVEADVYPPSPRISRTEEEMQRYLKKRVTQEMLFRQQRRAQQERELYPERFQHLVVPGEVLEKQITRLYKPATPPRKVEYRQPTRHRDPVLGYWIESPAPSPSPEGEEKGTEKKKAKSRESPQRRWRYGFHEEPPFTILEKLYAPPKRKSAPLDPKKREERIRTLSKPLRVAPKVVHAQDADAERPPFKVPRQLDHKDQFVLLS